MLQISGIAHVYSTKRCLPFEKRGFADRMFAAKVCNCHATFLFTQYLINLYFIESALLHRPILKKGIRLYSFLDQFAGPRSLRNKGGDAHAGGRSRVRFKPRHAALTVNLAGSMALFLIETWQARNESDQNLKS